GVTQAAYSTALPFVSNGGFAAFNMRSPRNPDVEIQVQATLRVVSADYFPAMRLRLVSGRTLTDADTTSTPPAIVVNRTFARLYAVVLAWFAVFALLIAGVGLFGVLSFSVAQRTREIGVRSALGAQAHDIVALILGQAIWIVGAGVLVGLSAALAGVRLLSAF